MSCLALSSLDLAMSQRVAASLDPSPIWPSLDNKQLAWALTEQTDRRRRKYCRNWLSSKSEAGLPRLLAILKDLLLAHLERKRCRSDEASPNWPTTKHWRSPNSSRRCSRGPICPSTEPRERIIQELFHKHKINSIVLNCCLQSKVLCSKINCTTEIPYLLTPVQFL